MKTFHRQKFSSSDLSATLDALKDANTPDIDQRLQRHEEEGQCQEEINCNNQFEPIMIKPEVVERSSFHDLNFEEEKVVKSSKARFSNTNCFLNYKSSVFLLILSILVLIDHVHVTVGNSINGGTINHPWTRQTPTTTIQRSRFQVIQDHNFNSNPFLLSSPHQLSSLQSPSPFLPSSQSQQASHPVSTSSSSASSPFHFIPSESSSSNHSVSYLPPLELRRPPTTSLSQHLILSPVPSSSASFSSHPSSSSYQPYFASSSASRSNILAPSSIPSPSLSSSSPSRYQTPAKSRGEEDGEVKTEEIIVVSSRKKSANRNFNHYQSKNSVVGANYKPVPRWNRNNVVVNDKKRSSNRKTQSNYLPKG